MGMVKRVLYTATGGSVQDPEAVSWSRNKTGAMDCDDSIEDPDHDLQNTLCLEEKSQFVDDSPANFIVFSRASISRGCLS